jgi:Kef-type K+ transport system membrane component KefB
MSQFLQLLLLLTLIIAAAKMAGALAARIGQPAVFGEILAGLVLGPTVANVLGWPLFAHAADAGDAVQGLLPLIRDLAEVGVLLLMFVAGLETDLEEMRRVGKVAFWAAFGGVALPMAGGAASAVAFGLPLFWEGIFIGAILTATSVSISAQTLRELGALRTREGSTILGAAVIDDVMGIVVLSLVVAFAKASQGGVDFWQTLLVGVRIAAFFAAGIFAGRWFTPVLEWASRLPVSQGLLAAVVVVAFLYAWAAEYIGSVAAITGSYRRGYSSHRPRSRRASTRAYTPSRTRCSCRSSSSASACRPTDVNWASGPPLRSCSSSSRLSRKRSGAACSPARSGSAHRNRSASVSE